MVQTCVMAHLTAKTGLAERIAFIENRRRPPAVWKRLQQSVYVHYRQPAQVTAFHEI